MDALYSSVSVALVSGMLSAGSESGANLSNAAEAGQASALGQAGPLSLVAWSGEKGASGGHVDSSGLNEELLVAFELTLPDLEAPSEKDVLSSGDIAQDLLVGTPRAAILHQAGAQVSPLATVIQEDEPSGGGVAAEESALAGLFLSPLLLGDSEALARLRPQGASVALTEPPEEASFGPDRERGGAVWQGLALAAAALAALALRRMGAETEERNQPGQ
jgi:hypothetical protein